MTQIRPALCMDGGKAVTIPEAGAGPGYGIDVKEQLTETPPAYHRGDVIVRASAFAPHQLRPGRPPQAC
jgi:hypothetical protein